MSKSAHNELNAFPEFVTKPRGGISVKVRNSLYNLENYALHMFPLPKAILKHYELNSDD